MNKQLTVGELIEILQKSPPGADVVFYHLENYNLEGQEVESIMHFDEGASVIYDDKEAVWVELTLKAIDSDEGGNFDPGEPC